MPEIVLPNHEIFVPTQHRLSRILSDRGLSIVVGKYIARVESTPTHGVGEQATFAVLFGIENPDESEPLYHATIFAHAISGGTNRTTRAAFLRAIGTADGGLTDAGHFQYRRHGAEEQLELSGMSHALERDRPEQEVLNIRSDIMRSLQPAFANASILVDT